MKKDAFSIADQSLIRFEALPFDVVPATKWVFFSSRNSVRFFSFGKNQEWRKRKLGAIGLATANALKDMGLQPDFIGEGNDTRAVALRFAKEVGADRVLFPMAEASLRTIQKALPREQVVEQVVYRTREDVSLVHNNAAILVFTSPSNVRSYLKQARVLAHQTVVAIGPTTAKALKEKGVEEVYVPELPTEEKLAELICSL